jgi:branched-subunit amino acid transport protein
MSDVLIWGLIAGMAVTNFALRAAPIQVMSRMDLPEPVRRWLSYVPVSVMAAIVALQVLRPDGHLELSLTNHYLLAAVPTAIVYRFTKSFLGATVAGIITFLALRYLLV